MDQDELFDPGGGTDTKLELLALPECITEHDSRSWFKVSGFSVGSQSRTCIQDLRAAYEFEIRMEWQCFVGSSMTGDYTLIHKTGMTIRTRRCRTFVQILSIL